MRRPIGLVLATVPLSMFACTSSYSLTMTPDKEPKNDSFVTELATPEKYKSIMVIPPSGTVRGEFDDAVVALFERELLKKGIKVTSGAITGRVVFDAAGDGDGKRKVETSAQLSDAERALILKGDTNADAILQIGQWSWGTGAELSRFFILDEERSEDEFVEVTRDQYEQWHDLKYAFSAIPLDFVGRLTDVKSGQVVAAYKVKTYANWHLPGRYETTMYTKRGYVWTGREPFQYASGVWIPAAKDRASTRVIEIVAASIGPSR